MSEHKGSSVATYILIALILGVITYFEFAIVEFEVAWLSSFWTFVTLAVLSVAKFVLVIAFFMHLKDDETIYTGFFSSGMAIALGTFIALSFLFILPRSMVYLRAQAINQELLAAGGGGHGEEAAEHGEEIATVIASNGYSRPVAEILDSPPPKTQYLLVEGPADDAGNHFNLLPDTPVLFEPLPGSPDADTTGLEEEGVTEAVPVDDDADTGVVADPETDVESEPAAAGQPQDEGAVDNEALEQAEFDPDVTDAVTDEAAEDAPVDVAEGGAAEDTPDAAGTLSAQATIGFDEALGAQTYTNCVGCHQANGQGLPGVFPPLAGHMPTLYAAEGGRDYLIEVMLYGLQGEIVVDGASYNGVMPGWAQTLTDEQIAAVLNHELTAWDNSALLESFEPIEPDEVAAARGAELTVEEVLERRNALELP